ncbi:MAG TPA: MFS transporter [Chloroflexota bacterium]|nr:MFS transporter [Chloroflexota bacterium]
MDRNRLLGALSIGHGIEHWYEGAFWIFLAVASRELGLSFAEAGALASARSLLGALGHLGAGAVSDVLGRPLLLLTGCLAWLGLSFCLLGLAPGYLLLIVLSGALGMGAGLWHPPAMAILSRQFPDRRGLALSAHELAGNIGTFLTPTLVGLAIVAFPWRAVLLAQLVPGAVVAALFWLLAPRLTGGGEQRPSLARYRAGLAVLLRNRTVLAMALVSALRSTAQIVLMTFLPLFLAYRYELDAAGIGFYVSVLASLGVFSPLVGGPVSDRVGRRPVLLAGLLAVGVLALAIPWAAPGPPLLLVLAGVGLFLFALRAVVFAHALDAAPGELGASTVGVLFGVQQVVTAFAPALVGLFADHAGLGPALLLAAVLALAGAAVVLLLPLLERGPHPSPARTAAS